MAPRHHPPSHRHPFCRREGLHPLMSQDDVGTIRTLTVYKEGDGNLDSPLSGQVVDAIGDSLLACFDSILDAVGCAAEMQRSSRAQCNLPDDRKMEFRMGISLGDVVEEEGASTETG